MNNTKCKTNRQRIEISTEMGKSDSSVNLLRETRNSLTNNSEERPVLTLAQAVNGQVNKSIRRMPWHWEPKKDVISCEKLR